MNQKLKIFLLLGGTAAVLGTVVYFATRKPETPEEKAAREKAEQDKAAQDKADQDKLEKEKTDQEKKPTEGGGDEKKEPKPKPTLSNKPKPTSTQTDSTPKPKPTPTPTQTQKTPPKAVPLSTALKGNKVSFVLSKSNNTAVLKGQYITTAVDKTVLRNDKNVLAYTLNKDVLLGTYDSSYLTKTGDYLVYIKMKDGKIYMANGNNVKFS